MNGFGEQIAVLDGITIAPGDGMYGGGASYPDTGRWPLLPSSAGLAAHDDLMGAADRVYNKRVFASPSGGANMSGGSSYPDSGRFPVWAQAGAGMAGLGAVLPTNRIFASPSGGANYSGGSTYPDGGRFPVWAQAGAGLAGMALTPKISQMTAWEIQQLLQAAGSVRGPTGVWGSSDVEALVRLVMGAEGEQDSPMLRSQIKNAIVPYAGGKMVFVLNNFIERITNVARAAQGGGGLSGFGTMPNALPPRRIFASPSGGANMSGGSSYPDSGRFPVWAQAGAGLAGCGSCRFEGLGAYGQRADGSVVMSPSGRAQAMKNIQFRSQMMVNLRNAARRTAPRSVQRENVMRAYHKNLAALCILRARVGLPTLPECQNLVARMKMAASAVGAARYAAQQAASADQYWR